MAPLLCVGLSYETASVAIREKAALTVAQQREALHRVAHGQVIDIAELVIVSTCNRTEFYAVQSTSDGDNTAQALSQIFAVWRSYCQLSDAELQAASYQQLGQAAVQHLCQVAAGLDSQVIGEPQILGQVADAYELALNCGSTGATLSALMQAAIQAGKRIRTETALGQGALSIGSVAAIHASQILGVTQPVTILVIGAGEMAQAVATAFIRRGTDRLLIANHTLQHAQELAAQWDGEVVPFTRLHEALHRADLVITATASPHILLHRDDLLTLLPQRAERPLVIFDVALPRNVDPGITGLSGVHLYNLDDLQTVRDTHYSVRQSAVPEAQRIANEEAAAFARWQSSRSAVPVIQQLRAKAEAIRQSELERLLPRLGELSAHEQALLDEFSQRLVNKLLHSPTLTLKSKSAIGEGELYADVVDELWQLTADHPAEA